MKVFEKKKISLLKVRHNEGDIQQSVNQIEIEKKIEPGFIIHATSWWVMRTSDMSTVKWMKNDATITNHFHKEVGSAFVISLLYLAFLDRCLSEWVGNFEMGTSDLNSVSYLIKITIIKRFPIKYILVIFF